MEAQLLESLERLLHQAADDAAAVAALEAGGFMGVLLPEADGGAGLGLDTFLPMVMACGAALVGVGYPRLALARAMGAEAAADRVVGAAIAAGLMAGALRPLVETAAGHVATRRQFGRPLAGFQAVQHQLAEMMEALAAARLAAAIAFAGPGFAMERTAVGKIGVAESADRIVAGAHQLMGAMGMTREHPLYRWVLAVRGWQAADGTAAYWAPRLGRHRLAHPEDSADHVRRYLQPAGVSSAPSS